jgi:hypothetical protein
MPAPAPAAAAATPAAAAPAVAVTTAVPTAVGPRRPRPWTPAQLAALKTRWEWFPGFDAGGRFTDADFKVLNDIVGVEKKRAATWRDSQRRARKRVHARRWQPSLVAQVYNGAEEPTLIESYYAGTKRKQLPPDESTQFQFGLVQTHHPSADGQFGNILLGFVSLGP